MKAIEEKIIDCLRGDSYGCYTLSPRDSVTLGTKQKSVCLWGHTIFTLDKENNIRFSFQGWQTSTTKGRINALLAAFSSCSARIYQKNYQLFFVSSVGEFPIDVDKIYTIENGRPVES